MNNPVKCVGVDFSVAAGKFQGSRSYLFGLYAAAITAFPNIRFVLYHPNPEELNPWSASKNSNVVLRRLPSKWGSFGRLGWWIPRAIREDHVDVIHTQYMVPVCRGVKRIVTIHDVLFEDFPRYFPLSFRLRSRVLIRLSAKLADAVITVSDYSARAISSHFKIPSTKIAVTPNGVDLGRFNGDRWGDELYQQMGLSGPGYILLVGRIEARKNVSALIEAYSLMPDPKPQLLLVGRRDEEFLDGIGEDPCRTSGVRVLDSVQDRQLPALYAGAALFVYPSKAEGFGMPLLEAMASGVPVIASPFTAIPEVVGNAALVVDPDQPDLLAKAMTVVLNDQGLRKRLRLAGLERVKCYQWSRSAQVLAGVINGLVQPGESAAALRRAG